MHWNAEPFRELYENLVQTPGTTFSGAILKSLEVLDDDFKALLATPNKSESARQTLAKGLLKIEKNEYNLSTTFMYTAAQVSDELQLNEMAAAQLVMFATENAKHLGVGLAEAALLIFYFRRAHILDIVRLILELRPSNYNYEKLLGSNPGMLVLKALIGVQKSLEELQERLNRGTFLQRDADPQFVNTIQAQREFLIQEHQMLACILYTLVQDGLVPGTVVVDMLKEVKEFSSYSTHLFAYLLPLAAWFEWMCTSPKVTQHDITVLFDFFQSSETWRLQWWKGGLLLLFSSYYYSYIASSKNDSSAKHSQAEVLSLVRSSINEGGLEFLAAITYDTSVSGNNITFNDFDALLRTRVPQIASEPLSPLILERLTPTLEFFAETFISSLACILREMRLSEEDAYLALSTDSTSSRSGVDLERFFLFVAYLYRNREGANDAFWANQNGPLYGFLKWGAEIQVAFISAAFNEMLASLSIGSESASAALKLLKEKPTSKSQFSLTWTYIHDVFQYYAAQLEDSNKNTKLDDDTVLVLFSYLHLISQIVTDSSEARAYVWKICSDDQRPRNLVTTLFSFMRFQTPLYAPIFSFLAGVVTEDHTDELWKLCDEWAFSANIIKYQGNGVYYPPSLEPRFDVLLSCVADVIGFVRFIAKLSQATSSCKIPTSQKLKQYSGFVIGEVFVWTSKGQSNLAPEDKALLQSACMATLFAFLRPLGGKLVQVPASLGQSLNIDNLVDGENSTVTAYLDLFPYNYILDLCFDRSVYEVIFSVICTEINTLIALPENDSRVKNVIVAIKLVTTLLKDGTRDQRRFDEPTLYNLRIVSQLAMYWSSRHYGLALASLQLVKQISQSDLFTPLPSRRDRILSIIESSEGAGNIKLGLIEQLSRDEWAGGEFNEELSDVKVAILELLTSGLEGDHPEPNFAHYLLGFKLHGTGKLQIDDNIVGAVGSDLSLLDGVCATLKNAISLMSIRKVDLNTAKLAYLSSEVLLHLIRNTLSSDIVLKLLRDKEGFLLELLKAEPVVSTKTLWDGHQLQQDSSAYSSAQTFYYFFKRRAALIEMVSVEFHTSAKKQLLSLVSRYVKLLMNLQNQSTRSVLHFLDFMKFRLDAAPELPPIPGLFDKPLDAQQELDVENIRLLLLVLPTKPSKSTDEIVTEYSQALIHAKLRDAQLSCLQPWSQLVPVLVNDTREIASESDTITFVFEIIQTLVPKLVDSSRTDLTFCKPLASLLVLLLERYQESHKDNDVIAIDRLHSLYRAAVMCIQSAGTFVSLRSDLYVICYQTLQMTLLAKDSRVYQEKLDAVATFGDRIVQSVSHDALYSPEEVRLVALIFLQMLATVSSALKSNLIENTLISHNLLQVLVQSLSSASLNQTRVTLCLFLELSHSRQCAQRLLQSGIIEISNQMRVFSPEAIREKPQYDVYLIMFQVLIAIVLALGSENKEVLGKVHAFLSRHHHLLVTIIETDSAAPHMNNSPLSKCATALARLVSLTGYTKE